MKRKWWKILLGSAAVLCLFIAGNFHTDAAAGTVTEKNGAVIQEYTKIGNYRENGAYKAPNAPSGYFGYVFAGWYTDEDLTTPLNAEYDNTNPAITNSENTYYAKFVPKEILGVRVQVSAGTTYEIENTNVRFITTVDSKYYSKVGFDVELNGTTYNGESNRVYRKLYVVNTKDVLKDYLPQNVFHEMSRYFLACKLTGVKHADYGDLMKIRPYWVTLDGTKVYGDTVNKTVNQAYTSSTASVTATQFATFARDTSVDNSSCYAQGGCTDGTYYYQAFVYQSDSAQNDDTNDCVYIGKYTLVDGNENNRPIVQSENLDLHHANDMTYNKDLTYTGDEKKSGLLVICHNAPYNGRVSFVDPDTLEIVNPNGITDLSDNRIEWKGTLNEQYIQLEEGREIFAIEYNSALKQYVVGISGGQTFRILKPDFSDAYGKAFEPIDNELANFTRQGVGADDKYIYFVLHNRTKVPYNGHAGHVITVYDWQGNAVKVINIVTDKGINVNKEPENISIYDNVFYVGVGGWNSLELYQLNRGGWSTEIIPEYEAYIGLPEDGEYYTTLEEAVKKVKEGETITIVAENVEIDSAMCIKVSDVTIKNETDKNVVIKRSSDYVGPVFENSAKDLEITRNESGSLMFAGNNYAGQSYVQNISGGTMSLNGLTFKNIETTESGAAVCATSGTVTINTCEFKNNIARTNGGALCIEDSANAVVTNSKFITNKTINQMGGAIYNYSNNEDGIVITDCTFDGNSAASNGGAIYNANGGKITLNNSDDDASASIFQDNVSGGNGGAICIGSGTLGITGYEFIGNSANRGGAVRLNGNNTIEATISGSIFKKNIAHKYGGAISNASKKVYTDTDEAAVTISECTFGAIDEGNSSPEGGAIYNETSKLKLDGTQKATEVFQGNKATNNGGAIYVLSGTVDVSGYQFANNQAPNGGAIAVCGDDTPEVKVAGTVKASSCTFDGNVASTNGGAVYLNEAEAGTSAEITNSTFVKNTTSGNGGAIFNKSKKSTLEDDTIAYGLVVEECTFGKVADTENGEDAYVYANTAINETHAYGGAIYTGSGNSATPWGNTKVVDSNFYYNKASDGGAIGTTYASNVTIEVSEKQNASSLFKGNDASIHGGAIFLYGYVNGTVEKCKFEDNHSMANGGALYADNYSNLDVTCSKFTNNTAEKCGGAIYSASNNLEVSVSDSLFTMNKATENGGAIYSASTKVAEDKYGLSVTNCAFGGEGTTNNPYALANKAVNGGAIYTANSKVKLNYDNTKAGNALFERNQTTSNGGAVYIASGIVDVNGYAFLYNTTAKENNDYGGAIYNKGTLTVVDTSFKYNEAANGGAIGNKDGTVVVKTDNNSDKTVFEGNKATTNKGGSIRTDGGTTTITKYTLKDNYAKDQGGAIYADKSKLYVNYSKFTNNTADSRGGAICNAGSSTTTIKGDLGELSYFDNNHSKSATEGGGALSVNSGTVNVSGYTFKGNDSVGNGGAIYSAASGIEVAVSNSIFTKNQATKFGGAIYTASTMAKEGKYALNVSSCTFGGTGTTENPYALGNQANRGGAIWSTSGKVNGENCDFIANKANYVDENNKGYGGALCITGGNPVTFNGGKFEGNSADDSGGAIYKNGTVTLEIIGMQFIENTNTGYTIRNTNNKGNLILTNCTLDEDQTTSSNITKK